MYPLLHLWWLSLSMTWLGIVSFLLVFIIVAKNRAATQGVQFRVLLRYLPLIIMLGYLLGTWSRYLRSDFIIFPFDPKQRLLYLSPYEYHFHFTWLLIGVSFGRYKFLQTQRRETHLRRRTILFESLCLASIPLWIFLLFGDHFIGKPIDTWWYLSAIDPLSKVAAYDKVVPLWLYFAAWSSILYLVISILNQRKKNIYRAFPWLMMYRAMIAILLIWQIYPRHLVAKILWTTVDIKQYLCILLIVIIARQRRLMQTSSSLQQNLDETDLLSTR
jgi:hypothetical protein